eukprot:831265_1
MSNVSIPEDFPMISIECTSADSNTNSHQEPTAEWNQACTDIIFGGSSLLLPSLKQQYDEQHDLCVHNVVSSNPIQHLYHKQNVINKQKNKIMILSKQKHQMNKEIESKDIEMSQIQTKHTQVISKKDITLFINKCIERDDNINFLKHIYHQIGVHLQERDKWTQPTKWFGSSTRTLQRHVSEVLDFIVQKANKQSDRILQLIYGLVDRYAFDIRGYLQINNHFNPHETARFMSKWRLSHWHMQGSFVCLFVY